MNTGTCILLTSLYWLSNATPLPKMFHVGKYWPVLWYPNTKLLDAPIILYNTSKIKTGLELIYRTGTDSSESWIYTLCLFGTHGMPSLSVSNGTNFVALPVYYHREYRCNQHTQGHSTGRPKVIQHRESTRAIYARTLSLHRRLPEEHRIYPAFRISPHIQISGLSSVGDTANSNKYGNRENLWHDSNSWWNVATWSLNHVQSRNCSSLVCPSLTADTLCAIGIDKSSEAL